MLDFETWSWQYNMHTHTHAQPQYDDKMSRVIEVKTRKYWKSLGIRYVQNTDKLNNPGFVDATWTSCDHDVLQLKEKPTKK